MVRREAIVINEAGIHARPATLLVKKASTYKSEIFFEMEDKKVNAKSIRGLLGLGASKGKKIVVEASGEDEEVAATQLASFISQFQE